MKSLEIQVSVVKSQDSARAFHLRDRMSAEHAAQTFRRDLEKKSASVPQPERADTARIEDRKAGGKPPGSDGGPPGGRQQGRQPETDADKDPQKGRIVDITAGCLA